MLCVSSTSNYIIRADTGCVHSFSESENDERCPFCNSGTFIETTKERIEQMMKRVEVNDAGAMSVLGSYYHCGRGGFQQDQEKAMKLWKQAAELGSSKAHFSLGMHYEEGGDWKLAKFHYEVAAMARHELARYNLGYIDFLSGKKEQASKHMKMAASAGVYRAMNNLLVVDFKQGLISRDEIDSILTAYNNSCAEMRSEARDAYILMKQETLILDLLLSTLLR
jgi:TPR repeat protein